MFKNKFLILYFLLLFTGTAFCQPFTASHVKKVEKLLEVFHFDKSIHQQMDVMLNSLDQEPKLAHRKKDFEILLIKVIDYPTLKKDMSNIYLSTFTEREVDEMIKFYQTDAGQKILSKMPEITKQLLTRMQSNMAKNSHIINEFITKIALDDSTLKQAIQ